MKKYIFILTIISLIFVNAYSEDGINEQTEDMLNEIRNRNGIDYFEASADDENAEQDDTENTEPEIFVTTENEAEAEETEKPPPLLRSLF